VYQYNKEEANKRYELPIKRITPRSYVRIRFEGIQSTVGGAEDKDAIPIPVRPSNDDFLGPQMRWVVEAMGSPYAQAVVLYFVYCIVFRELLRKIARYSVAYCPLYWMLR
jgi:hypothetical protein